MWKQHIFDTRCLIESLKSAAEDGEQNGSGLFYFPCKNERACFNFYDCLSYLIFFLFMCSLYPDGVYQYSR